MANLTSCVLKLIIIILMNLLVLMLYNCNFKEMEYMRNRYINTHVIKKQMNVRKHRAILEEYYRKRKDWKTSVLGSILFQNETIYVGPNKSKYIIFVWKHWYWLRTRHVFYFGKQPHNPFTECSVNNCKFTGKDKWLNTSDAVLVHLPRGSLPNVTYRKPHQRWIFLDDGAPATVYSRGPGTLTLPQVANVFNWSMSYRSDSDIPVPYGRTIPLSKPVFPNPSIRDIASMVPNWKNKRHDVLITVLMTQCGVPQRKKYLNELKKFTDVDIYGPCSDGNLANICPGYYNGNCNALGDYLFYFVFEDSMCRQYMTEKVFFNAYDKGAIPIINGPPLQDCKALLPPNSFIHVDDFLTPSDLAKEIIRISNDDGKLLAYHQWRNHFEIVNEHGFYGTKSYHLCRICEALNFNDASDKVYGESEIRSFLDEDLLCNNVPYKRLHKIHKKQHIKPN